MNSSEIKKAVGVKVIDLLVKDNMKLGMGTGSTALEAMRHLKIRIDNGDFKHIYIVPTSLQTEMECRSFGLPLYSLNDSVIGGRLDLTIDGADEVDPDWHLIKGGGGAHFLEKIVAYFSDQYAIMVDETKIVEGLARKFPVPVEVSPAAVVPIQRELESLGATVSLRMAMRIAGPVITKQGNLILDCLFSRGVDPVTMEKTINSIPGVIENGFFTLKVHHLFTGYNDGRVVHKGI